MRYRQWLNAMEMRERKIKEQYSQLDPLLQNLTMAEQVWENELGYIIHQRQVDRQRAVNKMLDERDFSRKQGIQNTVRIQKEQMKVSEETRTKSMIQEKNNDWLRNLQD